MIGPGDITVVIPTHPARGDVLDPGSLVGRAVDSVRRQTLPARFTVTMDDARQGAAVTRQRGLDLVETPWTAFLDSDDFFMPEHLEALAGHAEDTGADYNYSWYKILTPTGVVLEHDPVFPPGHYLDPWDPADPRQTTITVLVRTELAKEVGFVAPTPGELVDGLTLGEDYRFTLGCNERGKISHLVQKTWYWAHHGLNSSGIPGQGDA
jgi:glycosyltransferase involved in cell wall biosynthesis